MSRCVQISAIISRHAWTKSFQLGFSRKLVSLLSICGANMCIEIGQYSKSLDILASQVRFIAEQEGDEIPAKHLKVRCPCLKLVKWSYAYRCLYCGVFFCKECAEEHFGKTVDEYRREHNHHDDIEAKECD